MQSRDPLTPTQSSTEKDVFFYVQEEAVSADTAVNWRKRESRSVRIIRYMRM